MRIAPALGSISPYGLQRGKESEVSFGGGRLADAQQLLFYSPGISTTKLEAGNDGLVKATLNVAADCRMGIHAVRVRTATGISNLMTFTVGPFAELAEVEPNTEFAQPQAVAMNTTVTGVVQNEDVDHFAASLFHHRDAATEEFSDRVAATMPRLAFRVIGDGREVLLFHLTAGQRADTHVQEIFEGHRSAHGSPHAKIPLIGALKVA